MGKGEIIKGKNVQIHPSAIIKVMGNSRLVLHENVKINQYAVIEISNGYVEIGRNSVVGIGCVIQGNGDVYIGEDVIIGYHSVLLSTTHERELGTPINKQPLKISTLTIDDDVWIGANCTINCGIVIGKGSIIGANSFLNKNTDINEVWGGVPAKYLYNREQVL